MPNKVRHLASNVVQDCCYQSRAFTGQYKHVILVASLPFLGQGNIELEVLMHFAEHSANTVTP